MIFLIKNASAILRLLCYAEIELQTIYLVLGAPPVLPISTHTPSIKIPIKLEPLTLQNSQNTQNY